MGNCWRKKESLVQPANEQTEETHDPQLDFMYKIVRMINQQGSEEKKGDEIDKEICRVLSSNEEIFESVISSKKAFHKKATLFKTSKVKMRGLEGRSGFPQEGR